MTAGTRSARAVPHVAVRMLLTAAAVVLVCAITWGAVRFVASPAAPTTTAEEHEAKEAHDWTRSPQLGEGLGEFAVQALLVAGIAVVGRKVLKIRL